MNWVQKVKELMNKRNINQKQLSELSGITEASISRYLAGERTPRIDIITNFARVLDVEVDYLLDEQKDIISDFDSIKTAIARHGNKLTEEQLIELSNLLLGKEM